MQAINDLKDQIELLNLDKVNMCLINSLKLT